MRASAWVLVAATVLACAPLAPEARIIPRRRDAPARPSPAAAAAAAAADDDALLPDSLPPPTPRRVDDPEIVEAATVRERESRAAFAALVPPGFVGVPSPLRTARPHPSPTRVGPRTQPNQSPSPVAVGGEPPPRYERERRVSVAEAGAHPRGVDGGASAAPRLPAPRPRRDPHPRPRCATRATRDPHPRPRCHPNLSPPSSTPSPSHPTPPPPPPPLTPRSPASSTPTPS
jgi:hypothetical protein